MNSAQFDSPKAVLERAACRFGHVSPAPCKAREPPRAFHTRRHGVIPGQHVAESALANQNAVDGSLDSP